MALREGGREGGMGREGEREGRGGRERQGGREAGRERGGKKKGRQICRCRPIITYVGSLVL